MPKPRAIAKLSVFVELRAPNYPGSTYTLVYDPKQDQLRGTYFQAALGQIFHSAPSVTGSLQGAEGSRRRSGPRHRLALHAGARVRLRARQQPDLRQGEPDKSPTKAMHDFCASTPNAEIIPLSVIGHENPMIYDWMCKGKQPTITRQIFKVDAQGFPTDLWKAIAPGH